ncbi:FUSC family protein [Paraburkholderia susongensis]|uniref:Fusaric acid resistance protein family protein n=1 Tax=Paraburkholderia susongensis TaxID=1515439 RepID=A0A1X7KXE9_9BURK|nr:FUSC family protein [Paraburkholderia susongensis]SMG46288.1 Fusaric acid resistance protein family protein [Paraburkholderia susongensis]
MAPADSPTVIPRRSALSKMVRALTSPYYRYRHAKVLHSLRVGLALLTSIVATTCIDIPHGIWSSVTLLVVIGGLQHHGNIRKKAVERAAGTLLGASIGLLLIVQQNLIGSLPLTYLLMAIVASICAWFAIGSNGYVGLLTAITMCIVAGNGDNLIAVGLWRTLNVLIGIVIALAFSFAFPLHATYSWRYGLAANLREYARIYARLLEGETIVEEEQVKRFLQINKRLVQLRSLIPSVAREIDVPQTKLEEIQRLHRSVLSALELLATGPLMNADAAARTAYAAQCGGEVRAVRAILLSTARGLRFGRPTRLGIPAAAPLAKRHADAASALPPDWQGPYWLGQRLAEQVDRLRALLLETEPNWNIERHGRSLGKA